jgi:hypothetical protein
MIFREYIILFLLNAFDVKMKHHQHMLLKKNQILTLINQHRMEIKFIEVFLGPNNGAELCMKTENCSIILPNLHLILYDDDDLKHRSTEIMTTSALSNIDNNN